MQTIFARRFDGPLIVLLLIRSPQMSPAQEIRPVIDSRQPSVVSQTVGSQEIDARQAALDAARWIQSTKFRRGGREIWPAIGDDPSTVNSSLYSGVAGVVLFYLEAYRATGDPQFLGDARSGAEYLLDSVEEEKGCGLYEGIAGLGFVLDEVFRTTREAKYRNGANRCIALIQDRARRVGAGAEWSDTADIVSGSAGIGLYLLAAARDRNDPAPRELAVAAGKRLVELGQQEEIGMSWKMDPTFPRRMPNFSHGTAGVAYFLASLYLETNDVQFLHAAIAGANYLMSIARQDEKTCLIYHHAPGGEELFYLGWCHGPAGTGRLFYRLYQATGDETWLTLLRQSAESILQSGIPGAQTPGFWNNVGQCCGSAGVADFFLALWGETGDRRDLEFARRVVDDMLARATPSAGGLKWIQAEHRSQPDLLIAQTGYMQGAAGIGSALVHFATSLDKRSVGIRFPDSPF